MKINIVLNDNWMKFPEYTDIKIENIPMLNDGEVEDMMLHYILDNIEIENFSTFIENCLRKIAINGIVTIIGDDFATLCYSVAEEKSGPIETANLLYKKKYCYVSTELRNTIESYGFRCVMHDLGHQNYILKFKRIGQHDSFDYQYKY